MSLYCLLRDTVLIINTQSLLKFIVILINIGNGSSALMLPTYLSDSGFQFSQFQSQIITFGDF